MAATRTANAHWEGTLFVGSGRVSLDSSGLGAFDVSWPARTDEAANGRTSPEELIAAAHSACYNMALSNVLAHRRRRWTPGPTSRSSRARASPART